MHVGVTPTQHGTTQTHQKRLPKPPSWPSSHQAIGRLWIPPTSSIDLNCCLVYHVSLSCRDGQRLQIEFGKHGMGLTKLDSHQQQCVMGVLSPCMRVSPDHFSIYIYCLFSHWYLSHYVGQISILFSNFACCTSWLATDEKRYASNCLTHWICLPEGYPACNSETKRPLFEFYTAWPFLIGWDWLAWKSILRCAFDAALSLLHTVCR